MGKVAVQGLLEREGKDSCARCSRMQACLFPVITNFGSPEARQARTPQKGSDRLEIVVWYYAPESPLLMLEEICR